MARNEALRTALGSAGLTTVDLATTLAVDPKTVERWVSKGRLPHPRHRIKTAELLREDVGVLWPEAVRRSVKLGADREMIAVYPRRLDLPRSLFGDLIGSATRRLWFGGYTSYFVWLDVEGAGQVLADKTATGADVRFLLGDPNSVVTRHREEIEATPLTISTRIAMTRAELTKHEVGAAVRLSDRHIAMSVWVFDDDMLVSTHIGDGLGQDSVTMHLRRRQTGGAFDRYADHFEQLWTVAHAE
ncbi:helix-turn-helix domain-containing protein [Catellatospora sp. NPDC049133]|uniref:helix-turn-helix domain-containing protein n=1 Tax=Catellatospora sp. NPDC049133 TaxID=3155499 RepID=UPI0033C39D6C